jgi:hypothetical protein
MSGKPELEAKIVEAIYGGACDPSELKRALELIAGYFDSSSVILGELDAAHPNDTLVVAANGGDDKYFENYQAYAEFDPAPRAWMARPAGKADLTDRIFSNEQRQRFLFLNEFLLPRGIDGSLGSSLSSDRGRFAMIAVLQSVGHNYGDDDIARLERITPHLARTLQIRRLFLQNEARGKVLESIVDRNETGMIGLPGEGSALFVNRVARAIASAGDGIGLNKDGRPVLADRAAATRFAAFTQTPPTAARVAWCGFRGRRATGPISCWFRRYRQATTCLQTHAAACCSPFTIRPTRKCPTSNGSRNCCTSHLDRRKCCKRCSKVSS